MWLTAELLNVASTVAVTRPLAWKLSYATGVAIKKKKKKKKELMRKILLQLKTS